MPKLRDQLAATLFLCGVSLFACAEEPLRIDIETLVKADKELLGRSVVTHACLVDAHHGMFIEPCGENDGDLIRVLDPGYKAAKLFRRLGINLNKHIEADFAGTIVRRSVRWPFPGHRIFLEVESINDATPYEP